jgi:hypothetical protein
VESISRYSPPKREKYLQATWGNLDDRSDRRWCDVKLPSGFHSHGTGKPTGNLTAEGGATMVREVGDFGMGGRAMVDRPDLVDGLTKMVAAGYVQADSADYGRCMDGKSAMNVIVCLGQGRCMYPAKGHETRVCAFCKILPAGVGNAARSPEAVRRFVMGN